MKKSEFSTYRLSHEGTEIRVGETIGCKLASPLNPRS